MAKSRSGNMVLMQNVDATRTEAIYPVTSTHKGMATCLSHHPLLKIGGYEERLSVAQPGKMRNDLSLGQNLFLNCHVVSSLFEIGYLKGFIMESA